MSGGDRDTALVDPGSPHYTTLADAQLLSFFVQKLQMHKHMEGQFQNRKGVIQALPEKENIGSDHLKVPAAI
jgi:hypothetical protein